LIPSVSPLRPGRREKVHKETSWISPLVEKLLEEYSQRLEAPEIEKEIEWDAKDYVK